MVDFEFGFGGAVGEILDGEDLVDGQKGERKVSGAGISPHIVMTLNVSAF